MASNFPFLQAEWPVPYAEGMRAEQATLTEPRTIRRIGESFERDRQRKALLV